MSNYLFLLADKHGFFSEGIFRPFLKLCLAIDSVIYNIISWLYSVLMTIARARVFTSEVVNQFTDRLYLIIGIIALFFAAYTFLTIIVNPDNLTKGKSNPQKLVLNVVASIICITFIPAAFNFAYSVQNAVIDNDVITKVVIGGPGVIDENDNNLSDFGVSIFETMFYVKYPELNQELQQTYLMNEEAVRNYNDLKFFGAMIEDVINEDVEYYFILAGIVGIFIAYVLLCYCIDIAIRGIKLCFLEIISPLPSLLLMVPGQDKMFKSWLKETLRSFGELFLKIAILIMGIYMLTLVRIYFDDFGDYLFAGVSTSVKIFAKLFLFIGVFVFIKRAPKLLSDIFGINLGENGLSLGKRINEFKDSIKPFFPLATTPIGLAGGAISGGLAGRKMAASRGGNKFLAGLSGAFHGARLGGKKGLKGSLKGLGEAHNYAVLNQQAWSHMDPNHKVGSWFKVQGEMLRDNFGYQSYYKDKLAQAQMAHDVEYSANSRVIDSASQNSLIKKRELEARKKYAIRSKSNTDAINLGSNLKDKVEKEIKKPSYKGTTKAQLLRYDGSAGKWIKDKVNITGSLIDDYSDAITKAMQAGAITESEAEVMRHELSDAEDRLISNYMDAQILSRYRENGEFSAYTGISDARLQSTDKYKSFIASYIKTQKDSAEYKDAVKSGSTSSLDSRYQTEAKDLFEKIVFDSDATSEYKVNQDVLNDIDTYHYNVSLKGENAVGAGVDPTGKIVKTTNADILTFQKDVFSGSELIGSLKALKKEQSKLIAEQNKDKLDIEVYYVDRDGNRKKASLIEIEKIISNLNDRNKILDEDLANTKRALSDFEQISALAATRPKGKPKN